MADGLLVLIDAIQRLSCDLALEPGEFEDIDDFRAYIRDRQTEADVIIGFFEEEYGMELRGAPRSVRDLRAQLYGSNAEFDTSHEVGGYLGEFRG